MLSHHSRHSLLLIAIGVWFAAGPAAADSGSAATLLTGLPNPQLTPGRVNPDMTEAILRASCHSKGWTKLYRPPVSFTNSLKRLQMKQYGYGGRDPRDFEEDHLVPLCAGGASQDPGNLWPQPRAGVEWNADKKDTLEAKVCRLVCDGKVPLQEVQHDVATNWIAAYQKYVASGRYGATRLAKGDPAE